MLALSALTHPLRSLAELSCLFPCADEPSLGCLLIVTMNMSEATCHKRKTPLL